MACSDAGLSFFYLKLVVKNITAEIQCLSETKADLSRFLRQATGLLLQFAQSPLFFDDNIWQGGGHIETGLQAILQR